MRKLLALVLVAIMAASPAFAAVQNVKVSGDIDSTYINRQHFNLGTKNVNGLEVGSKDQNTAITQTRLRVEADLSDNVSTTIGLINERAWDAEGNVSGDTNIQLYLAYATLRELLYSPLTVTVGRQVLAYGNGFILGDGGTNNVATGNLGTVAADLTKRTTWDGVKAVFDYKPLTLDLLYFRNSGSGTHTGNVIGAADYASRDNDDVYGLNANYQLGDSMNTVVEGYFFTRVNRALSSNETFHNSVRADTTYLPGLRVSTNPVKGLNVGGEVAWQLGNKTNHNTSSTEEDTARRRAFAAQAMASYDLPVLEQYKPVLSASYTYVSGDKNGDVAPTNTAQVSGETYSAWDPFFEAQGGGTIYNTMFNLTNMQIWNAGIKASPIEDVTAKFSWSNLYANQRYLSGKNNFAFVQPDGSTAASPSINTRKHIGNEYDVNVDYAYTEDVTFGLNLGWFVPGSIFSGANDTTASQALAHVLVNF